MRHEPARGRRRHAPSRTVASARDKVKNSGTKTLDTTLLTVNCSYGKDGRSSESVFDSDTGLDGTPQTKLLAGRSISVPWGCELPKGEKLIQIEVAPDFDSETAIFTGPVR
ncbi:hypothetical protein OJ963_29430 [Streptomyces sp. RS2]|uniref:hypothetical protein n=1 Tax=Streptomyces TaxID=1883 RepID=UPI001F0C55D7|nr:MULTISPECIES: hypothetical protein [unclassified Streptomyces]MCW1097975.1 hypothetical protein [Streptomyces sp. RS2]